ncbi:MAG TPA: lipoyl(octanoyl) transferase LipB [Alphaproteobacteria bacterium]|nr:lipoate-protein ligase B [Rhodospirillaceae bacterium]HRJ12921.1 lipoyl(octanoyl) transferase LipB [Alphaproteobacteria bacterium]
MEWKISDQLVDYPDAVAEMDARVSAIRAGTADELIWLLQHPSLYTAGTSAKAAHLIDAKFPVYESGRGGQYTYHGPGQRVGYVMLDLKRRTADVRKFVQDLEEWIILSLRELDVVAERREGRIGLWVAGENGQENKIAAIGVRVRQWVTFHGISINVHPDLSHYAGIVPCGISDHGVTSLAALGVRASMDDLDAALEKNWSQVF